jgi:hypothetical protein
MGVSMCSEKDCRIFRGMIQACDECRAYVALGSDEPRERNVTGIRRGTVD